MLTLYDGELTVREGRLTIDELFIDEEAILKNDAETYTYATVSAGMIDGKGTLWAHVSSKAIGGLVAPLQTIIYYGIQVVTRRYLQLMSGSYAVSTPSGHGDTK